jgi:hypothetical protein
MMEAVRTCETLVNLHQSTRRNNPEDSHFRIVTSLHMALKTPYSTWPKNGPVCILNLLIQFAVPKLYVFLITIIGSVVPSFIFPGQGAQILKLNLCSRNNSEEIA